MKTRQFLTASIICLAIGAAALLLAASAHLGQLIASPAKAAAPNAPAAPIPVWTSEPVAAFRTPGGLHARSLVTLPGGGWYFALGGDQVTLASEADPALYVDADVFQAQDVQIALDPNDRAALVYLDRHPDGTRLQVARPTANGYRRETVLSVSSSQDLSNPSLVVDSHGWLHLAYFLDGEIVYIFRDAITWHAPEVLASPGGIWNGVSLAVAADDTLHLVYHAPGYPHQLNYLTRTNDTWSAPTHPWNGTDPLLLVDSQDRLHLITASSDPGMVYGVLEAGAWVTETVDTAYQGAGVKSALALDEQGEPHISYLADICGGCYDLRYAYRENGIWHSEILWQGDFAPASALSVDGTGSPYLIYLLQPRSWSPTASLHTAMDTGGGWVFDDPAFPYTPAIAASSAGQQPALAAYQPGELQGVYRNKLAGSDQLQAAQGGPGGPWTTGTLSETLAVRPQIAVDAGGNTHAAYAHDLTLQYRYKPAAGSWSETLIATESAAPDALALAVDSQGHAGIAYRVPVSFSSYAAKFMRQTGSGWSTPITLASGSGCAAPGLAFDGDDYAHVVTACGQEIVHHFEDSTGWHTDSTTNYEIDSIARLAVVVDANGYAIIGMDGSSAEDPVVQSVWQDNTGWNQQSFGRGNMVEATPMQLDSAGTPTLLINAIVPLIPPAQRFDLRQLVGGTWNLVDFTYDFPEAGEAAFDLDPDDAPYLLYHDTYRDDLYLAYKALLEPPAELVVSGPTSGFTGQAYTFSAATTPADADLPLAYTWQAVDFPRLAYTGTLTSQAAYAWDTPGTKLITATVSNAAGGYWAFHTIEIEPAPPAVAPQSLAIENPEYAATNSPIALTASLLPLTTTVPLDYAWTSAEQAPIQHTRGLTDTVSFAWETPGEKTVAVSASNSAGTVQSSTDLTIEIPVSGVSASADQGSRPGLGASFAAQLAAGTGPTFSWDFGDGATGSGMASEHVYAQPGVYTVTLTAANHVSQGQAVLQLHASAEIFLPLLGGSPLKGW